MLRCFHEKKCILTHLVLFVILYEGWTGVVLTSLFLGPGGGVGAAGGVAGAP